LVRAWLVALAALGCTGEAPVPDKPTWAEDVLPILRGNCLHCHGPTAASLRNHQHVMIYRWDVLDLTDPHYAEIGFGEVTEPPADPKGVKTFLSARDSLHFLGLLGYVNQTAPEDQRMPPPPATRLAARDVAVLDRWANASKFAPGAHAPNHAPTIRWLQPGKVFAVTDEDGDQVLGKLDCAGTAVPIDRSGSHTLPSGVAPPCAATLYDGWGELTAAMLM
jgi:hypothetical protein